MGYFVGSIYNSRSTLTSQFRITGVVANGVIGHLIKWPPMEFFIHELWVGEREFPQLEDRIRISRHHDPAMNGKCGVVAAKVTGHCVYYMWTVMFDDGTSMDLNQSYFDFLGCKNSYVRV